MFLEHLQRYDRSGSFSVGNDEYESGMMIISEMKKRKPTSCLLPCFHYYMF